VRQLFTVLSGLTIAFRTFPSSGEQSRVGSSKPCLLACLVRSRCADRLKRNNGWSRSGGCDACHLGLGATVMLILSLTKGTRGAFTGLEKACLVLSGLGISCGLRLALRV